MRSEAAIHDSPVDPAPLKPLPLAVGRPEIPDAVRRVGGAQALPQVLAENGLDVAALLAEFGVTADVFADPEHLIPADLVGRLAVRAIELGAADDLGLRVGLRAELRSMGLLGYLALSAETVEQALVSLVHYYRLQNQLVAPALSQRGTEAVFGYDILVPLSPGADQLSFGSLASMLNFLRELCGGGFRLREARFAFAAPASAARFATVFGPRVRFEATRSELVFDAGYLARRPATADPTLRALLLNQVRQFKDGNDAEQIAGRVGRVLQTLMAVGRFSEQEVARCFGMNRRTLSRRLSGSGITYRALLDQARYELACQLLRDSSASLMDIASRLGFSDAVIFNRAFQRWSGTTPARWRREQRTTLR